ncbi:hypothetical protein HPB48_001310 [Haemaphysalis longicornis]|uniref:Peptidase M13 N-terminal domain-containing protein n=1 Tax=Haemaphysalis longicornis TaxID=44386 RepID=A0A9J6GSG6_HAELO|nr:hypothetical protein HPB48_001310 [Haemaphysalis longicornis]
MFPERLRHHSSAPTDRNHPQSARELATDRTDMASGRTEFDRAGVMMCNERAARRERLGHAGVVPGRRGKQHFLNSASPSPEAALYAACSGNDDPMDRRKPAVLIAFVVTAAVLALLVRAVVNSLSRAAARDKLTSVHVPCPTGDCDWPGGLRQNGTAGNVGPSHVCASWKPLDRFPELALSVQSDVMVSWIENLASVIKSAAAVDTSHVAFKPHTFYESCLRAGARSERDANAFVTFLRSRNIYWPELRRNGVGALGLMLNLSSTFPLPAWITTRVIHDTRASGQQRRILIRKGSMGSVSSLFWMNHRLTSQGRYFDYWMRIHGALMGFASASISREDIEQIAIEEADIINRLMKLSSDSPKAPILMPISKLGNYTENIPSSKWLEQINKHISSEGRAFTLQDQVTVSDASLLRTLNDLFVRYTDEKLVDHMSWQFVQLHAWIVDKNLLDLGGQNYSRVYQPLLCALETENAYRPLLAVIIGSQLMTPQQRDALSAGLQALLDRARDMFAATTWLDDESKHVAVAKLRAMGVSLWPPERFFNKSELADMYAQFQTTCRVQHRGCNSGSAFKR